VKLTRKVNLLVTRLRILKKYYQKCPMKMKYKKIADIIKALGDPTRLKIIYLLKHGELCVCEIMTALDKPQPTVSHHLNLLKNADILKWRKEGVWIHYKLSNPKLPENLKELLKNPHKMV
jgi:DNA-binding transcriptional ArsR family regulator